MYKYKYFISRTADENAFKDTYEKLAEKFPELVSKKSSEEAFCKAVFTDPESNEEKLCLSLDKTEKCVELYSEEPLGFLKCRRESVSCSPMGKLQMIAVEAMFLFMNLIMGAMAFELTSNAVGDIKEILENFWDNFLLALPFALVYFFSYPVLKRKTDKSGWRVRFIQAGGIVNIIAFVVSYIFIKLELTKNCALIWLVIFCMIICSVQLMVFAMVTAIIFELIVAAVRKRI